MPTNTGARPRDRGELVLRPMQPPQSDHYALLARALALYIERGLPVAAPFPHTGRGATVQRNNGTRVRLEDAEIMSMRVTLLADEYRAIVGELRREQRRRGQWVWYPGRGLARER
ncbi:MAG: hypothetical protein R3B59_00120 [Dehalococcoidia bacterium]